MVIKGMMPSLRGKKRKVDILIDAGGRSSHVSLVQGLIKWRMKVELQIIPTGPNSKSGWRRV